MAREKVYLFDLSPHLRDEWDYTRNEGDPETLTFGSNKKVWFVCPKGHEKFTTPSERRRYKCAYCSGRYVTVGENDLKTTHPDLAATLKDTKDALRYSAGSNKKAIWVCPMGHEHSATVAHKVYMKSGCPVCSGKLLVVGVNDLCTTHPDLVRELVNPLDGTKVTFGRKTKLEWKCDNGHTYGCTVNNRTSGKNCPYCTHRKLLVGYNDLASCFPDLVDELVDPSIATTVQKMSTKTVAWKCPKDHVYRTPVNSRTNMKSGCPKCSTRATSKAEIAVRDFFVARGYRCNSDHLHRLPLAVGKRQSISVDIELLDLGVVVEYDGAYFHQERVDFDHMKTKALLNAGYRVVRIREQSKDFSLPLLEIANSKLYQVEFYYTTDTRYLDETLEKVVDWVEERRND